MERKCKNCKFWAYYENRVWAKLSNPCDAKTRLRGIVELRQCQWEPHPSIDASFVGVYVDEEFCCKEWEEQTE